MAVELSNVARAGSLVLNKLPMQVPAADQAGAVVRCAAVILRQHVFNRLVSSCCPGPSPCDMTVPAPAKAAPPSALLIASTAPVITAIALAPLEVRLSACVEGLGTLLVHFVVDASAKVFASAYVADAGAGAGAGAGAAPPTAGDAAPVLPLHDRWAGLVAAASAPPESCTLAVQESVSATLSVPAAVHQGLTAWRIAAAPAAAAAAAVAADAATRSPSPTAPNKWQRLG